MSLVHTQVIQCSRCGTVHANINLMYGDVGMHHRDKKVPFIGIETRVGMVTIRYVVVFLSYPALILL